MDIEIRKAAAGDAPFIVALWGECFSLPWSEASIMNEIRSDDGAFFVAESAGERVGYALMKCALDEGQLCNIATSESVRGRGIGCALTLALIDEARRRSLRVIMLEVRESNTAAIKMYEKCGFFKVGERKNYYRLPKENALLYDFDLRKDKNEDTRI